MQFCLTRSQSKSKEFEPEGVIKLHNSRHDGLINKCLISIYLPLCKKCRKLQMHHAGLILNFFKNQPIVIHNFSFKANTVWTDLKYRYLMSEFTAA